MDVPEQKKYKPVVLVILDGFGVNIDAPESTWRFAQMPTLRSLEQYYPLVTLQASGIAVGLPWGQEGNSEVGHLTLGAGRALYHHLPRIISSIDDKTFFQNPAFVDAAHHAEKNNGAFHIMGLFSSGSVHAYADHLYALLDFAATAHISRVYLHLFTDGKDAPSKEGGLFFQHLEERLAEKYPSIRIASVMGRFFSLDRDANWDRVERAYRCLTEGKGNTFEVASQYINASYEKGLVDGAIEPAGISDPHSRIKSGDAVVFFNYREDSEREITAAFVDDAFTGFSRTKIENLFFVTMTEYETRFPVRVAFPPLGIEWPLARTISGAGLKQLHIAETEKYAHVTYFFNGGKETAFSGEDRVLVPSPHVAHFDEVPEMSASKITDAVVENLPHYDFILINLANGDMVGHTGNFSATVKAMEVLDFSLGRIIPKVLELGGAMVITSDHGNAEEKVYATSGEKRTKHTSNPVPCFIVANEYRRAVPRSAQEIINQYNSTKGVIADVAPTVLTLLGIRQSAEMTGVSLLKKVD
ncbi:MAG: 2,3-bisphosphoglycerate-independent phosphoglycerate mutase [Patescibacteria group bacterium]|jgi:2,3-bisphosphoglycerate-independent phosphoglycerate mutase